MKIHLIFFFILVIFNLVSAVPNKYKSKHFKTIIVSFELIFPYFLEIKCGKNQEYLKCGPACDVTCSKEPCDIQYIQCPDGCYCIDGYKRDSKNNCIPKEKCPEVKKIES